VGWDVHEGMGWWMLWGSALWLFTIVAIVVAIGSLLGRGASGGSGGSSVDRPTEPRRETSRELVERRYAGGEIGRDEFLRIIADLEGRA
jgi:putative membrane protein